MTGNITSPCMQCGACCATYRVDFSVQELDSRLGRVPEGLTQTLNRSLCRMRGTDHVIPRCCALTGEIGVQTSCAIYEWRPGPCHEMEIGSNACLKARARLNLPEFEL